MATAGLLASDRAARGGANGDSLKRRRRHRNALVQMTRTGIPFLVGGGYALRHYTKGVRGTKDLDVFVCRRDALALLRALSAGGFKTDLTFPHWLGKARFEGDHIDVIYSSGNGVADVDGAWFTHAVPATVLGVQRFRRVRVLPRSLQPYARLFVSVKASTVARTTLKKGYVVPDSDR